MITIEEISEKIHNIWTNSLKQESITLEKDFFELGGDSLKGVSVIGTVNKEFNTNFFINDLFDNPTIKTFSQFIYNKLTNQTAEFYKDDNIIYMSEFSESKKTIFLIHDGSGTVNGYSRLIKHLEEKFNCVGIQFVYDNLYPTAVSIQEIAKKYLAKIYKISKKEHYHIVGWSTGAKIAIEIISQLEIDDKEVTGFLFDYSGMEGEENIFTAASEIDFIRELSTRYNVEILGENEIEGTEEIEKVWEKVLSFLEEKPSLVDGLVSEYPEVNINEQAIELTLKEMNIVRMLSRAQGVYTLDRKILSELYHFVPKDLTYSDGSPSLGLFEDRITIEGDHYTMIDTNLELISEKIIKNI